MPAGDPLKKCIERWCDNGLTGNMACCSDAGVGCPHGSAVTSHEEYFFVNGASYREVAPAGPSLTEWVVANDTQAADTQEAQQEEEQEVLRRDFPHRRSCTPPAAQG